MLRRAARTFMTASSAAKQPLHFAQFDVSKQAFLRRERVAAIVNLRPIVPGHVLVIPTQPRKRLADLTREEGHDLWDAVQDVSQVVQRVFGGQSLTVSCQDGPFAGQSVPHVHFHILPRREGDIAPNDLIYEHLDRFGLLLASTLAKSAANGTDAADGSSTLKVDADEDRKPRTMQQMQAEAAWLSTFFE